MTDQQQPWWEPTSARQGDEFAYSWRRDGSPQGVVISLKHLYEDSKREVHGEIRIDVVNGTGKVVDHLHWSSINLSGQNTRRDLTREMNAREVEMLDWQRAIRFACTRTAFDWRKGDPEVILAHLPPENAPADMIEGFLPFGETSTLYADGSSAKSLTAVTAALAVALGRQIGPFKPVRQANVLLLDWETTDQEQRYRIFKLSNGLGRAMPENVVYQHMQRRLEDDIERVRALIDQYRIGFLVVDSLSPAVGGEQKEESGVVRVFNALRSLKGITRTVISHIAKGDRDRENDSPYGAVFVYNLSRAVWKLKTVGQSADENIVTGLYCTKRNRGALYRPIGLRFDFDDPNDVTKVGVGDLSADPDLAKHLPLSERITAALKAAEHGVLSIEAMAEITNSTPGAVRGTVSRMGHRLVAMPPRSGAGQGRAFLYGLSTG